MQRQTPTFNTSVLQSVLWFICIPQCVLLLLNIRSWQLVSGEAGSKEIQAAAQLLICEVLILLGAIVMCWFFRQGKLAIGRVLSLVGFIAHASYMFFVLNTINDAIPNNIQPWIVSEGNVGRWNITLFMPGAFITLYAFSKLLFADLGGRKAGLVAIFLSIGVPLLWYLFATLLQPMWLGQFTAIGWIIIGTTLVTLFLGALIYIFDGLVHGQSSSPMVEKHYAIAVLLGLMAPLGGLLLNRSIPFPVDFQSTDVYILTVLNGLILLLKPGNTRYLKATYFLRCVSFPFIAYFFLVFLPFLPLSLLAIIVVGTGFLMLTPLALGLFQFRVTQREYHLMVDNFGKMKTLGITLTGLLILPGYFAVEAALDKAALNKSLNYFYAHDFTAKPLSETEIERAAKALVQLRDRKSDIQMPYISGFYNAIVFGEMVMPNSKITQTYHWLTGEEIPSYEADIFGNNARSRWRSRGFAVGPESNAFLETIDQRMNDSSSSQTIRLTLKNQTEITHTQYLDTLHIPEGVFVTGLRLKIGNDWVDGRIFDRKAAMWVFQKITEVRRDPAIIYYSTPSTLTLRVYPFPPNGTREVELDFLVHQKIDAKITIGDRIVDLNPHHTAHSLVSEDGTLFVDTANIAFTRKPYLHFILDFSAGAKLPTLSYIDTIKRIGEELGIDQARVTAANIASSENDISPLISVSDRDSLATEIDRLALPARGGFWMQRAIAHEILRLNDQIVESDLERSPTFVVMLGDETPADKDIDIHQWRYLIPDLGPIYVYKNDALSGFSLASGDQLNNAENQQHTPVVAIKVNDRIQLYPADTSSILDAGDGVNMAAYNPASHSFSPVITTNIPTAVDGKWGQFAAIWNGWQTSSLQPSLFESKRQTFLDVSRKNNLLLPSTAFIIVESASQWKILERKEDQSLKNHSALEFEEQQASEPPWWLLLGFMLLYMFVRARRASA